MPDSLVETWQIHNRINLYLLRAVDEKVLDAVSAGKGRSVWAQFAHIHNVRLMWLKASAPELLEGLAKVETESKPPRKQLEDALTESGEAVSKLIQKGIDAGGKIKGFKPHVSAFVGYLISHESHHRGQIVLSLKESGVKLDKKILFGMWEWGSR